MSLEKYPYAFSEALARPDLPVCREPRTPLDELVPLVSPHVTPQNSAYSLIRSALGRTLEVMGTKPEEVMSLIAAERGEL